MLYSFIISTANNVHVLCGYQNIAFRISILTNVHQYKSHGWLHGLLAWAYAPTLLIWDNKPTCSSIAFWKSLPIFCKMKVTLHLTRASHRLWQLPSGSFRSIVAFSVCGCFRRWQLPVAVAPTLRITVIDPHTNWKCLDSEALLHWLEHCCADMLKNRDV